MYYQPINSPRLLVFTTPESVRVHVEHCKNIERLIRYNNKRLALGLAVVTMPGPLIYWRA